ncbi:CPBP family intramembrane glutamic endopeptidase [Limosilactobacillus pontis]|uniref:CPBP family intramembrane glutamic endopeptidase n=1 Tax=Limosilactobacillus pontis TaxID=35787 RepID=UPI0022456695|nr:type II CAAX endopeptidase family protein [Limosilactobacillus pontis]MCX2186262.1 CPBP family intramembrane metalloprotease [Limosilactobacillus pontis]MCX2187948.1 CPBP family intramembrane metalloprotease [Limosilactobacillus pontis]
MSGSDYLKIWYRVQIGATLLILAMMMIRNYEFNRHRIALLLLCTVAILAVALVAELWEQLPSPIKRVNAWLQALTQPLILILAWDVITREIIVLLHLPSRGVVTLMIVYYFIMFAPFASVIGSQLTFSIERFIFAFWTVTVVFLPLMALPIDLIDNHFLLLALSTGAVGTVAYFILMTTAMRAWKLSWPGLRPHWSGDFNWWILLGLVVIDLLFTSLNVGQWPNLHLINWHLTMSAFEAGVTEETLFRFAVLGILFYAWRNIKQRLPLAIVTSALLFGLAHLSNAMLQHWDMTVLQALSAFALGLFFAVVYVYTGQLWLAIVMHGLLDWTSFIVTGSDLMKGATTWADWLSAILELVVFAGITAWMMFGQRRKVMERHVARLTGEHQHFGFMVRY